MIVGICSIIWLRRICCLVCLLGPATALAEPFTIVALPDTQNYAQAFPVQFSAQTQWIVDNRTAQNIVFVTQEGDIVQNGALGASQNQAEWNVADSAFGILDAGSPNLPYGVVLGNHDLDNPNNRSAATRYVDFFGASRYAGSPWYGGSSSDERNHYQRFMAGGRTFLNISLEWRPLGSSLSWAHSVLDANPTHPTIITTHEYSGIGGRNLPGQTIFNSLVKENSQVFMVLSGHVLGEGQQTATNTAGQPVFELLANYQGRANGGDGWMRLIEFDEANSQINVKTFSPTRDQFETDASSQFSLTVDFDERFGPAVPEPSTFALAALGLLSLFIYSYRAT